MAQGKIGGIGVRSRGSEYVSRHRHVYGSMLACCACSALCAIVRVRMDIFESVAEAMDLGTKCPK